MHACSLMAFAEHTATSTLSSGEGKSGQPGAIMRSASVKASPARSDEDLLLRTPNTGNGPVLQPGELPVLQPYNVPYLCLIIAQRGPQELF